jgi:hypothetical protein
LAAAEEVDNEKNLNTCVDILYSNHRR